MTRRHPHLSAGAALVLGLALGWAGASWRGVRPALADGGDRWGESIVTTGPLAAKYNPRTQVQVTDEAIFYLNYASGTLLATTPILRQTAGGAQFLSDFAERDLVKDFELAPGTAPHFLMTTASLGSLSEGGSALVVFEATTGQVATYRMSPTLIHKAGAVQPSFELVERKSDRRLGVGRSAVATR